MMRQARLGVLMLAVVGGCARGSDETEAKRAPASPPPVGQLAPPAALAIEVVVDGHRTHVITAASLTAQPPDWHDADRRAWRLTTLIPAFVPGASIEGRDDRGVVVRFAHPSGPGAETPALQLSRRGEVNLVLVDPTHPFPAYHGQGGRLRRPGADSPRLAGLVALHVVR